MLNTVIRNKKALGVLVGLFALGSSMAAQDSPGKPAPKPVTPIKVDLVISRFEGDKKISSLPFTLSVDANQAGSSSLRMGMDVAIPSSTSDGKPTVSYRNVGTSIDCSASSVDGGKFELLLQVQDSSIYSPEPGGRSNAGLPVNGYPAFRTFTSSTRVIVHEGQSTQYTLATDKISGEVLKVDVTVNAVR